jgi:hypothetical protein
MATRHGSSGLLVIVLMCSAGCTGFRAVTGAADLSRMQVDGIPLAYESSDTSREVIAMLGLEKDCGRPTTACAERIMSAPGTVRRGTRQIAAAEQLYRYAVRGGSGRPQDGWLGCAQHTEQYFRAPELEGRRGAIEGRSQLALRLYNACVAGLLSAVEAGGEDASLPLHWDVDGNSFPRTSVQRLVPAWPRWPSAGRQNHPARSRRSLSHWR